MNLHQKLIEVRKVVPYIPKGNKGAQYNYVSSSDVLGNCIAKMNELGVLLIPSVVSAKVSDSVVEGLNEKGQVIKRTTTYFTELSMSMKLVNAEKPDEFIESPWYGQGVDIAGEKGVGKALTYAEKYFLLKLFNIATDKDDPDTFQQKHGIGDETPPPSSGKKDTKQTTTQGQTAPKSTEKPTQAPTAQPTSQPVEPKPEPKPSLPQEPNPESNKQKANFEQVNAFYAFVQHSGANEDIVKIIQDHEVPNRRLANGRFNWNDVSSNECTRLCSLFETGEWQSVFHSILAADESAGGGKAVS
jgi:hypothetical protein